MNSLVRQFFLEGKEKVFQEVIFLDDKLPISWEEVLQKAPHLPRGWFELSRLSVQDRIEFTRDFWLDRMPYHPSAHPKFFEFFERLDDVCIALVSRKGEPMQPQVVYSLADNSAFFRGNPAAADGQIKSLREEIDAPFPQDYLSFMKIHNGFGKMSEMGLLELEDLAYARRRIMDLVLQAHHLVTYRGRALDPAALVPFYETLGLDSFQCFDQAHGMGNFYFSGVDYSVSGIFPTFSEWLSEYLEGIDLCLT